MARPIGIRRQHIGRIRRSGEHAIRRASTGARPLPDFIIVGAQKAGTTSLHEYLCQHSRVSSPVTKEIHFFDHNFSRGTDWYKAHFRRTSVKNQVTGESTPYYLYHPLVPRRAADTLPGCRLIVVLRNPIDRAFSHHNHERALGFETLGFEQALAAEPARLAGEEERLRHDGEYSSWAHQHHSYLARGHYPEQIERWLAHFDRERFLFLSAEDLFADPATAVSECQEFLGLPPEPVADLGAKNARSYAPISPQIRADLRQVFAADNARLARLLDRDFGWD